MGAAMNAERRLVRLLLERGPNGGRTIDHLVSAANIIEYEAHLGYGWWTNLAARSEKIRSALSKAVTQ